MTNLQQELITLCHCIDKRKFFTHIEHFPKATKTRIEIQEKAAALFCVPIESLKAETRKSNCVKARQVCMWYEKNNSKFTLATIGFEYGGRDHATVLHACTTIQNMIDTKDPKYYSLIMEFVKFTEN